MLERIALGRTRATGKPVELTVAGRGVACVEYADGFRLWTRADDLRNEFTTPAAGTRGGRSDVWEFDPLRANPTRERGAGKVIVKALEFFDVDITGMTAKALSSWFEDRQLGDHGAGTVDAWVHRAGAGEAIPVSITVSALAGELPGEIQYVCMLEDGRQRQALEAERRRAARQKELLIMAAEWAHDVRTPLTGILHSAELLAGSAQGDRADRHFEVIRAEVQRINELVNHFLDYARPVQLRQQVDLVHLELVAHDGRRGIHHLVDRHRLEPGAATERGQIIDPVTPEG